MVAEVAERKTHVLDAEESVLETHYSWEMQKASESKRKGTEKEEKLEELRYS